MEIIPEDVKQGIIYDYVQDLLFLDHKKEILRKLANDAFDEFKYRFEVDLELYLDDLHYAEDYVNVGKYEQEYGPSGDYGNYDCHSLKFALDHYKGSCENWNEFVDSYIDIADEIVPTIYKNVFKHVVHEDSYWVC